MLNAAHRPDHAVVVAFPTAWAKIRRARRHLEELRDVEDAYSSPNRVRLEMVDTGTSIEVRARIAEPIPADIPLIVGDIVHNLRASLDHVVYDALGGPGEQRCEFPTAGTSGAQPTPAEWKKKVRSAAPGHRGAAFRALLHPLQPYRGGAEEFVCTLHRLDIVDKHRLLLATFLATDSVSYSTIGKIVSVGGAPPIGFMPKVTLEATWIPEDRELHDGAVVANLSYGQAQQTQDLTVRHILALNETGVPLGVSIARTMLDLADQTEELVQLLATAWLATKPGPSL